MDFYMASCCAPGGHVKDVIRGRGHRVPDKGRWSTTTGPALMLDSLPEALSHCSTLAQVVNSSPDLPVVKTEFGMSWCGGDELNRSRMKSAEMYH
ncbi:hypothetical protein EVAR_46544_1 [Eumeta japonica]|uniref:Uncharacterized protein n=1 Tax=Eumeta variegata TaxID=151549 RepID=A0A4C1XQZ1_EUMVA|nr:hypothetical protein EVAR_46544_1 [Eumeta japonica]